jgi:hypothetical protein
MTEEYRVSEPAAKQIALCHLILRGDHWLPFGLDAKVSAGNRSSPSGAIIRALLMADIEGQEIVGWRKPSFIVQEVLPDGSVQGLDLRLASAALEAAIEDAKARDAGVVGISERLVKRRREAEEQCVPEHLRQSAFDRAAVQILDRLHGRRTIGVTLVPA